jgi:hypothetical protein
MSNNYIEYPSHLPRIQGTETVALLAATSTRRQAPHSDLDTPKLMIKSRWYMCSICIMVGSPTCYGELRYIETKI